MIFDSVGVLKSIFSKRSSCMRLLIASIGLLAEFTFLALKIFRLYFDLPPPRQDIALMLINVD